MLVFITSTYKDLYRRDILNVCCKQTDDLISFSYSKTQVLATDAKGKEALIIFAEYKGKVSPKYIFHPVRCCTVAEAIDNTENAAFTYHLQLKDCISYQYGLAGKSKNDAFIEAFNAELKTLIAETVDGLIYYFRDIDIKTPLVKGAIETTGIWPNLANYLGSLNDFANSVFFRQLAAEDNINFKETDLKHRKPIKLKTGKIYNLSFLLVAGHKVTGSGVYPTIETSENVSTQGPFISQESNAISLKYILITKSTASKVYSSFVMKANPEASVTYPISPEINSSLTITPGRWLSVGTAWLILLGLIVPTITEFIPKDRMLLLFWTFTIRGATLIKIIKVVSSGFVAVGTYLVYKKIPKSE